MAIGWYICEYKRDTRDAVDAALPIRYCAMDDFTDQINADRGDWSETEVLGNRAIVKVRASVLTLQTIAATARFFRLPKDAIDEPLSSLTNTQKMQLRNQLTAMGYPDAEIQSRLGNDLGSRTLGDVLRFATTRRKKPRYDAGSDTIIIDGPNQPVKPLGSVDSRVR